jgi:hypothetical protein
MAGLRYLFYVAFAVAALILWPLYFMLVLGIFPFPAEPTCAFSPGGCPPPTALERLLGIVSIFGAVPLTVLLFVFYRRRVRRLFGKEDGWS